MPQQEVSQTTFDSSSSRPEAREGAERRGESSRTIGTSSQSEAEALLALLNATNVDLHEASEGTHFLGGGADDHSSQALETLRVHGRTALDRTRNLDGELGNIGPSHAAIVLSPADSTSALEHLSNAMDELLAGHPGPADVAAVEQNRTVEHRSNTSIRMPVLRQRSRSNVETQTSSQAQTQGRTPPQRPTRDEFAFYLSVMPDSRRASGNDRHQEARPQDAASTTLGRRVAARTASAQGQENHNAEQWSRLAFRSRHRGRTSMTYATNAIGMSIQNVNENGSGTSNARPVTIEEDSYLPRLLDGLQTSEDEAGGRESSDTERDEDLRLRILALASADNAHALQTENTSGNTLRGTYNARTHTLLSTSGRSTPELVWPTQNFSRNTSANGHSVPQSVAISHPTSHTGSQTEDVFFPRSPSPTVFDEGVRIRPRAGPFREVVETVQSSRGSYQIRRHVNARGEEQVHQIRAAENMWDDFESSFYESPGASLTRRPSAVDRRLSESWESILRNRERLRARNAERTNSTQNASARTRATVQFPPSFPRELASAPGIQANFASTRPSASSSTSSSSSGATRRRGWARLNADGDEIPTDEEEEVERVRTEQRLRSGDTVFPVPATGATAMRTRLEYLAPTTRSIFTYGLEDEDAATPNSNISARVRLNPPVTQAHRRVQQLANEAADKKSEKNSESSGSGGGTFGTDVPYRLSPLPNSTLSFTSKAPSASPERRFVARQSEFAAR